MILLGACAAVALAALVVGALVIASGVRKPAWPEEAPLHLRDNRAHDLQLTHLTRLVGADDPRAVHEVVVALIDELVRTSAVMRDPDDDAYAVLSPVVRRFLASPPLGSADRYRRRLDTVLGDLEAL